MSTAQTWTWTKVLDYEFSPGYGSGGSAIVADLARAGLGDVFAGGQGASGSASDSGLVLKTTVPETSWSLSDNSNPSPHQGYDSTAAGLAFDSNGDLYSCGTLFYPCTKKACPGSYWYIRRSTNLGASWTTVDDTYQYPGGNNSSGEMAMTADDSGNIFVVGVGQDANGVHQWPVRKGSNSGQTWALVDHFSPLGTGAGAIGIGFVPGVVGVYIRPACSRSAGPMETQTATPIPGPCAGAPTTG